MLLREELLREELLLLIPEVALEELEEDAGAVAVGVVLRVTTVVNVVVTGGLRLVMVLVTVVRLETETVVEVVTCPGVDVVVVAVTVATEEVLPLFVLEDAPVEVSSKLDVEPIGIVAPPHKPSSVTLAEL